MKMQEYAEQVLERVKQAGADGDLIIDEGESLSLRAREGELEEHKVSSSLIFGLRVVKDGRVGTAYSEATDSEAFDSMVGQALTNASYTKLEPHEKILSTSGELRTDDELLCPEEQISVDEKIRFSLAMETDLASRDKVKNVPYNSVQDILVQRHVFNTAGLSAFSAQKMCIAAAYALMEEGEKNVMAGTGQATRRFSELDHSAIAEEAHAKCLGLLHGEAVPGKHYDVIFDEECQVELIGVFASMFSGKSAKDGVNPMRDKVGEIIADAQLSIYDQPLLTNGFGYTLFDAEGTATKETVLIKDGRLETLIHNSATASHFGIATTGHASRSPKSTLGVSLHQLQIAPGTEQEANLFAGEYLELTDLTGLHSGANPLSGQFSFGASGYLCRDGNRVQPVRNITVAGNFYEMLKKISGIGSELFWNLERTAVMPHIRFSDVAISG
jgi:PmbA protein